MDTALPDMTAAIEEALDDVREGRVYHAENARDLIEKCLS